MIGADLLFPDEKIIEYFRKASIKSVKDLDLKEIIKIQREKMSFQKE